MIGLPFVSAAVKATEADPSPAVAVPMVGAPGKPACGVAELEAAEGAPVPMALVAVTVKVYAVPLVRPLTVIGLVVPVPVKPPGELVAV